MKYSTLATVYLLFASAMTTNLLITQQPNRKIDSLDHLLHTATKDSTKAKLLLLIGDEYHHRVLKYDSALFYYQKALDIARKQKMPLQQLAAANKIANTYNFSGRYAEALDLSLESLELEEQIKDTSQILFTKREIIFVYRNIGDHQKELELAKGLDSLATSGYFKDAKKVAWYRLIAYNNIGTAYANLNQMDSARHYIMKMYGGGRYSGDLEISVIAANRLAEIYIKMGKLDSAFFYSRFCIANAAAAGRPGFLMYAHHWLAYAFQKKGRFDSALHYARLALEEYKSVSDTLRMVDMVLLFSDLYKSRKQFDSAYAYLSYHTSLKEKVLGSGKIKVQTLLFNKTLEQQQAAQEQSEAQQQYAADVKLYSLLAGLGVVLLLAAVLYRNNQQKQKAAQKIGKAYHDLKATQAQLIQSEKMASLGELTAGIAHEIQNPLNFVNNFSEVSTELVNELKEEIKGGNTEEADSIAEDIKHNLEKIVHHGKRADAIVKNMLEHSHSSKGQKQATDINALADEYLRLSYHGLRAKDKSFNATFKTEFDESIGKVAIIPQDIGRVFLNLFNNAFYAVHEQKKKLGEGYEPTVSVSTKKITNKIEVNVKDNGMGISKSFADKIFQPFFTTKPTGQGTGLGLSLSYDIVKAHDGELKLETTEGQGATFIISLPLT